MAEKKKSPDPEVVFTPAADLEAATNAAPPAERQAAPKASRYRVLSSGISTPSGVVWRDQVVSAEQLGDADRVAKLLDKGSIEVVHDAD